MLNFFRATFGLILVCSSVSGAFAGDNDKSDRDPITPTEALRDAKAANGEVVEVVGTLENAGTNYFTDRRLVLKDGTGELNVKAWLPMSAPRKADGKRPEVMSDYLGKPVVLTGMLKKQPVKGLGVTQVLVVTDANVK